MNGALVKAFLILGIIFFVVAIIGLSYLIVTLRKMHIVAKKVDYFVEDLTYKSEKLNTTVDAVVKLSEYIDVFEVYIKDNVNRVADHDHQPPQPAPSPEH